MTFLVALLFLGIVGSLGHALFSMASGPDSSGRMMRALTLRIALSIVLFAALALGSYFG
jgi:putative copper export protein